MRESPIGKGSFPSRIKIFFSTIWISRGVLFSLPFELIWLSNFFFRPSLCGRVLRMKAGKTSPRKRDWILFDVKPFFVNKSSRDFREYLLKCPIDRSKSENSHWWAGTVATSNPPCLSTLWISAITCSGRSKCSSTSKRWIRYMADYCNITNWTISVFGHFIDFRKR